MWIDKKTVEKNIFKVQDHLIIKHGAERESNLIPKTHALHQNMSCLLIFLLHVPKQMSFGISPVSLHSDLPVWLYANASTWPVMATSQHFLIFSQYSKLTVTLIVLLKGYAYNLYV